MKNSFSSSSWHRHSLKGLAVTNTVRVHSLHSNLIPLVRPHPPVVFFFHRKFSSIIPVTRPSGRREFLHAFSKILRYLRCSCIRTSRDSPPFRRTGSRILRITGNSPGVVSSSDHVIFVPVVRSVSDCRGSCGGVECPDHGSFPARRRGLLVIIGRGPVVIATEDIV